MLRPLRVVRATSFAGPPPAGRAVCCAMDVVVNPGGRYRLAGRFAGGRAGEGRGGLAVTAWLEGDAERGAWLKAGRGVTDAEGRVSIAADPALVVRRGRHRFRLRAEDDGRLAGGVVYAVERGTRAVVFDIDGTLTCSLLEVRRKADGPVLDGGAVPFVTRHDEKFPGADRVVQWWVARGHLPVYVTARSQALAGASRRWLAREGFPAGPVRTSDGLEDVTPVDLLRFKRDELRDLTRRAGLDLRAAYGNTRSDLCAYAEAGVDPRRTFVVGERGGEACPGHASTQPLRDFEKHLRALQAARKARPARST